MESFNEFEGLIQSYLDNFNNGWFEKKRKLFKSHPSYDEILDKIVIKESIPNLGEEDYFENDIIKQEINASDKDDPMDDDSIQVEIIELPDVAINFASYCSLYEPLDKDLTFYGQFKYIENPAKATKEENLREYAEELVDELCSLIRTYENSEVYKFIGNVICVINSLCEKQIKTLEHEEYKLAMLNFTYHCQKHLNWRFRKELMLKSVNETSIEARTLAFNLNKPTDVLALVHILIETGITFGDDEDLMWFILNHFSYYDKLSDRVLPIASNMNNLKTYYKRIVDRENVNGLKRIKDKLINYLNNEILD